jgi:hypothetical protein
MAKHTNWRPPDEIRAVTVDAGTQEARAMAAFLKAKRPPSIQKQFVGGFPHRVPAFWIKEGLEIIGES